MSLRDFQIISKLGEGAYSSVYKVKRLTDDSIYALKKVKLMNLSDKEKINALNEVRILASIRHPSIISYKEAFLDESSNSLCIIMEYADNGDLYQRIVEHQKKGTFFPEAEIWSTFIQMVKGLKALHDLKILHRDLKSANIFMNKDGSVKLGDLNVSKVAKKGLLYTQTGTPYYASPEVWRDMPYDNKSDVWSLGCVLYEMTTLKPPFRAEDMEGLYKKVLRGFYPRIPTNYSQDLNNIIRALLQVSPHLRPGCDKMLQFPSITKRLEEKHLAELEGDAQSILLSTIRIPKNLHFLTDKLPKPNYAPLKTKQVEKKHFVQTLAGYRERESHRNNSHVDEVVRGSESVDSHLKNEKDPTKIYLPPLAKENHESLIKISDGKDKKLKLYTQETEPKILNTNLTPNLIEDDINLIKRNLAKRKNGPKGERKPDLEKDRPLDNYKDELLSYKVHDLNKDIEKELLEIKQKYKPRLNQQRIELTPLKEINNGSRKIKLDIEKPENLLPKEYELHKKKKSLAVVNLDPLKQPERVDKLPSLKHVYNTPDRMKEISKIYKLNIGNLDDNLPEKYNNLLKGGYKREKYRDHSNPRNPGLVGDYD